MRRQPAKSKQNLIFFLLFVIAFKELYFCSRHCSEQEARETPSKEAEKMPFNKRKYFFARSIILANTRNEDKIKR